MIFGTVQQSYDKLELVSDWLAIHSEPQNFLMQQSTKTIIMFSSNRYITDMTCLMHDITLMCTINKSPYGKPVVNMQEIDMYEHRLIPRLMCDLGTRLV